MTQNTVLAVDLGAESGRVMAVHYDGQALQLEELNRFANPRTIINGTMYWDFLQLWRNIQAGIEHGKALHPASIGVDAWGVDFGLLDAQGNLIGNPVQYRDARTEGMMDAVFEKVPRDEVFAQTGIQFMPINTLYQMMSLVVQQSPQLDIARTMLTAPDLLNYWLTGVKVCEFTNATTTQMYNPTTGAWAGDMLGRLNMPTHILPEVVPPGTRLGTYEGIPVIAPACHDTGSAVAAVPAQTADYAYLSSGTWSLVGLEVTEPVINDAALEANVTNEGGVYGSYRLLKNVMGLWIIQQCRETWAAQGQEYSYAQMVEIAQESEAFATLINVNNGRFLAPGDHPQRMREWCLEHGQDPPRTHGAVVRCVLESLALKYREVLERLSRIAGHQIDVLHIVGGGSQNELLNQFTANAIGLPVVAGPVEATVIGNAAVQMIALGELRDIAEARQIISKMGGQKTYQSQDKSRWDEAYIFFQNSMHA